MDYEVLTKAIAVWTGRGSRNFPSRDDEAVVRAFGEPAGPDILWSLKALEAEFYASQAHATAPDLVTMGEWAANEFRTKRPDAPDEIVDALTWCYTFDWK